MSDDGPTATVEEPAPRRNQRNYRITEEDRLGAGSLKQKCRHNLAAIELLKELEAQARQPSEAEKRVLVGFVGWGRVPRDSRRMRWARAKFLNRLRRGFGQLAQATSFRF